MNEQLANIQKGQEEYKQHRDYIIINKPNKEQEKQSIFTTTNEFINGFIKKGMFIRQSN